MIRRRFHGFTVVEMGVAGLLLVIMMIGFSMLYFGQSKSAEKIGQKSELADQARSAYFKMTEEIKFGIDLLHPIVGSAPTPYLLFTKDTYELIAYWVEQYPHPTRAGVQARRLMRMNFNAKDGRKPEVVAPYVEKVQFTRKANREVDVELSFKDADENAVLLTASISCRNAVAVY
jgi:hypothetical protein